MRLTNLMKQGLLVDAHRQCGQHPSGPFCSVISIFDLVREEQTGTQCTTSRSQSDSFPGFNVVCDSGGSPAGSITPACRVADLGLNASRLCWP
jgi:hypothetical protein